jgi:hypothetical protein
VSQGYLNDAALKPRLPQRRTLATVKPLYRDADDSYGDFEDELDADIYEPDLVAAWYREPERHRALG